jgi:hypothetical protein
MEVHARTGNETEGSQRMRPMIGAERLPGLKPCGTGAEGDGARSAFRLELGSPFLSPARALEGNVLLAQLRLLETSPPPPKGVF